MSETLLIDVPKNRTKLDVWKERHGVVIIESDLDPKNAPSGYKKWGPIIAIHSGPAMDYADDYLDLRQSQRRDIKEAFNEFHYDFRYFWDSGDTEEDACFTLAQNRKLPWLESITQADCQLDAERAVTRLEGEMREGRA